MLNADPAGANSSQAPNADGSSRDGGGDVDDGVAPVDELE
jgi:hypothetical protein